MRRAYLRCFLSLSVDIFGGQTFVFTAWLYHLLQKKDRRSWILSNMNAYVIVRGSVKSFRNIVYKKGPEMKMFLSFWINLSVLPNWMVGTMMTCQSVFRCIWKDMPVHGLNVYKALMKWLSVSYLQLWSIILRQELLSGVFDSPWANCVNSKKSLWVIIRTMCVPILPGLIWQGPSGFIISLRVYDQKFATT